MNIKTRGEKFDEAMENVKKFMTTTLLVAWAAITVFFGIGMVANEMRVHELENKIVTMEKQNKEEKETKVRLIDTVSGRVIYEE